ncbi:MurR/RpiR family transcriptional regulator [Paenibacillus xylanilyticus]|uniref:MurR/RpiR family transcriptional regulator n=1 Tax=Paenibacillus xylanilyticus TaxID=248903 RepID=A0A7Y6C112_9BACL|nr:MurR/RpiR family transcriptional regulator [Paenibacillus xylanilyticus]NUU78632.1 MurR/RpiR family transcriptional regulator [Paenibacillus xylanilyticus]
MPPKWTVDYILSNPEVVFDSTAHELAQATYTSLLTIVRLCKKLGTKGYPDFQLKLALDYQRAPAPIPPLHHSFTEQGDVLQRLIPFLPFIIRLRFWSVCDITFFP